jgi:hypothetical protein
MGNEITIKAQFERLRCREGFMKCSVEMALCGMIYIPSFMKIGTGVQAILRFCLSKLRGCNVGITDGKDL